MEYYHYVNIFETKGLEYILVICFLITFVIFVRRLNMPPKHTDNGALTNGPVIVVPDEDTQPVHGPNGTDSGKDPSRTPPGS